MVKNITITGAVDSWFSWQVKEALRDTKSEIHMVITSNGGNVGTAIAISDMLAKHGNVTVEFSGFAASAATWLAFGAKKVVMHDDTLWLCHQSSAPVISWENMNADELDAYIKKLENEKKSLEVIDAIIAKKYLNRCSGKGKSLKDVVDLMKEERYLAPADCLEWGFVDELLPSSGAQNFVNQSMLEAFNLPAVAPVSTAAVAKTNTEEVVAAPAINEESLIERILDGLKKFFSNAAPAPAAEPVEEPKQKEDENNIVMNKTFKNLMALLGVDAISETDGKLTLEMDQMAAIEKRLEDAHKAEEALNKVSDKIAGMSGMENKMSALALVIDHMPAGGTVVPAKPVAEKTNETTVEIEGADEVNEYAKSMRR